ncbi:phage head closure protein [Pseudomonas sp. D1-36]|uniref:phage head closure protein n=1 Tax=Pseudomonas sp. D1-36 TaxID=2817387 RepID=UPI003DA8328A
MAYRDLGAGELDRRIVIRQRSDLPASDMGLDSVILEPTPRWARIEAVGTAVYTEGVQTDNKITHRIFIRYMTGITTQHEIVEGGVIYRVKRNAQMNGRKRFTIIEVEELGPAKAGGGIYV